MCLGKSYEMYRTRVFEKQKAVMIWEIVRRLIKFSLFGYIN